MHHQFALVLENMLRFFLEGEEGASFGKAGEKGCKSQVQSKMQSITQSITQSKSINKIQRQRENC